MSKSPANQYFNSYIYNINTKSEEKLRNDADVILNGSQGKVGLVIVVKITPVAPGQEVPQGGFVEVWDFDRANGISKKKKAIKRLAPMPQCRSLPLAQGLYLLIPSQTLCPPGKPCKPELTE